MDKKDKPSKGIMHFLTVRREAPKFTIIFPIILYIVFYFLTTVAVRSDKVFMIGHGAIPISATAGAISALSNICLVLLVLHFKKPGFIIALLAMLIPLPSLLKWIIIQGNVGSLTGLVTNIFTILMLVIIMLNHSSSKRI